MNFKFETTEETLEYCNEIVSCLIEFAGKSQNEAESLVNEYWSDEPIFTDDDFRLHEDPYYWAMCIIHDSKIGSNNPNWTRDKKFWPPPKSFTIRWYGQ